MFLITAIVHAIAFLIALGYANEYYFHLSKDVSKTDIMAVTDGISQDTTRTTLIRYNKIIGVQIPSKE